MARLILAAVLAAVSLSSPSSAAVCIQGVDHPNGDLPGMPIPLPSSPQGSSLCRSLCDLEPACLLFVFIPGGCEPTLPVDACYLKSSVQPEANNSCTCAGVPESSGNAPISLPPIATITSAYATAALSATGVVQLNVTDTSSRGSATSTAGVIVLNFEVDGFAVAVDGYDFNSSALDTPTLTVIDAATAQFKYTSTPVNSSVEYTLLVLYEVVSTPTVAFLRKTVAVSTSSPSNSVQLMAVNPLDVLHLVRGGDGGPTQVLYPSGEMGTYGAFLRYSDGVGVAAVVQNPFLYPSITSGPALFTPNATATSIHVSYRPSMIAPLYNDSSSLRGMRTSWPGPDGGLPMHITDAAILTAYTLTPYVIPPFSGMPRDAPYFNYAERDAFRAIGDAHYLLPPVQTVKVHIPWTENDYQVNVANASQVPEYIRILMRLNEIGVSHILYAGLNTDIATPSNNTDDWGWEMALWLSEGQRLRMNVWNPGDAPPASLAALVDTATALGVHMMPYIYPILGFTQNSSWLFPIGGGRYNTKLDDPLFQDWLIDTVVAFNAQFGSNGAGYDYTFFRDSNATTYAQWAGWRRIMGSIRIRAAASGNTYVVDNRQLNHAWGPWMWAVGSYAEPLQTDEGPYSWPAFLWDPHTDRQSANRQRQMSYAYSQSMFCQQSAMPGFMNHQTDRFLNGGITLNDLNVRDYDFYGAPYSILSSIATGGLNNVVCGLPARDELEFAAFPAVSASAASVSKLFYSDSLAWTDTWRAWVAMTRMLPVEPAPGVVDGTYMMLNNSGFIFLFNPNTRSMPSPNLTLDASLGLYCSPGDMFNITEQWPVIGAPVTVQPCGASFQVQMEGRAALVLIVNTTTAVPQVVGRAARAHTHASVANGVVHVSGWADVAEIADCAHPALYVLMPRDAQAAHTITMNGATNMRAATVPDGVSMARCPPRTATPPQAPPGMAYLPIRMSATAASFVHSQPVEGMQYNATFAGGDIVGTVAVPAAVFTQLAARDTEYPVAWTPEDLAIAWLAPARLLLYVDVNFAVQSGVSIPATLNGAAIPVQPVWSCRSLMQEQCFSGYWMDLTAAGVEADTNYTLLLTLPTMPAGVFGGVYYENVDTVYASGA